MFKFLHAADIHLDSPLRDLERYEGAPVEAIRSASRKALENLVQLALSERVHFVVIAGDVFDGDWLHMSTGLFFVKQMGRLREANIPVFLISGNHDAASRMSKALRYPENVHVFSTDKAETRRLDDLGIALHGQGYANQKEIRNLAASYPPPAAGLFNLGLLHTALDGREGHERYAPCTVEQLAARGYDYWALGHVHQRESMSNGARPLIEFPGNLQGRHIRETEAKGCLLIHVDASQRVTKEFRALDVFRWQLARVDCSQLQQAKDLQDRVAATFDELVADAEGRPLAVRVQLEGGCELHDDLHAAGPTLRDDIRGLAVGRGDERIWVEKVQVRTRPLAADTEEVIGEDALSELSAVITELGRDLTKLQVLLGDSELKGLQNKLPAELREGNDAVALTEAGWNAQLLDRVRAILHPGRAKSRGTPMRFLSITYRCFGHFEVCALDVAQGEHGLHLICGANEAGKSTALLGLGYFLFGFPPKGDTRAFRYPTKDQRITAKLRNRAGQELACIRSRSTKTPLTALDDKTPLGHDQLPSFLAGLTRDQFSMLFGLSHDDLVRGGREIIAGHGGLGQALFAAGAGLAGLRRISDDLSGRKAGLYGPRAQKPINKCLSALQETKRRVKDTMLQVEVYRAQQAALELALEHKEKLEKERRQLRAESRRLQDIAAALPTIGLLREVEQFMKELPPPDAILAEVSALELLAKTLGACQKAAKDCVLLVVERDQLRGRALGILRTHFRRERLEEAESLRLSEAAQQRIRALAEKRHALDQALQSAQGRLEQADTEVVDKEKQCEALATPPDVAGLDALRQSILQEGPLEKTERSLRLQLTTEQEKPRKLLQRLGLSGTLDQVTALLVPPAERIPPYAASFAELADERRELQRQLEERQSEARTLARQIGELELGGEVPREAELAATRSERDAGVELVRRTWLGPQPPAELGATFIDRHAPGKHIVDALQGSIQHSDAVADELRRESERVSRKGVLEHQRDAAEQDAALLQPRQRENAARQKKLDQAWQQEWQPCGLTAREPAEMSAWLALFAELRAAVSAQQATERDLEAVRQQIGDAQLKLGAGLALPNTDPRRSLGELLELSRQQLDDAGKMSKSLTEKESQLQSARQTQLREQRAVKLAEQNLSDWEKQWSEAVAVIGLTARDAPDAARAHLDHVAEIFKELEKARILDSRTQGIELDQQNFLIALDALRARLDGTGVTASTADTAQAHLDALSRRLTDARQEQTRRKALEEEAARERNELHQRARGLALDQYIAAALAERNQLEGKLEELRRREEPLDNDVNLQAEAAVQARAQFQRWEEASAIAAECRQEQESLVAGLREHVTEYAVLNLASSVLAQAIERFRAQHQDSMLSRASDFFRMLTNGSFINLEVEEAEPAKPVLLAVRANPNEQVPMSGLSDGTRDQLFLALRLAGIEEHLKDREPMPLIVDDILVNFDDARAAATLRCLAELSRQTQVLLFTHHEYLVELAKKTLGAGVVFCHRLGDQLASAAASR